MSRAPILVLMAALWPSGCTCTGADTVAPAPSAGPALGELAVSEVQPPGGDARGGPFATIVGEGFDRRAPVEVRFGEAVSPRAAVIATDRLQVEIPPGSEGASVTIHVRQGDREASLANGFRYRPAEAEAHEDEHP